MLQMFEKFEPCYQSFKHSFQTIVRSCGSLVQYFSNNLKTETESWYTKTKFCNWHISLVLKNKLFRLIYQLHQFPKGDLNSRPQLTFTFLLSDQRLRPLCHSASLSKFWLKLWELKYVSNMSTLLWSWFICLRLSSQFRASCTLRKILRNAPFFA